MSKRFTIASDHWTLRNLWTRAFGHVSYKTDAKFGFLLFHSFSFLVFCWHEFPKQSGVPFKHLCDTTSYFLTQATLSLYILNNPTKVVLLHLPITSQSLVSLSVSLRVCCIGTSGSRLTGFCGDRMPPSAGGGGSWGNFSTC